MHKCVGSPSLRTHTVVLLNVGWIWIEYIASGKFIIQYNELLLIQAQSLEYDTCT